MVLHKHISEQKIIDYILKNLNEEDHSIVLHHLKQCQKCHQTMESWQSVLSGVKDEAQIPSHAIKERIDQQIDNRRQPVKNKRKSRLSFWIGGAAATLMLTAGLMTMNGTDESVLYNEEINEMNKEEIQTKPDTEQLNIIPVSQFDNVSGNVWINEDMKELLVEIEGLADISGRNYQMWIIDTDDNVDGKVLPVQDGSIRILYQGERVEHLKLIKTSVEPLGGSQQPTGPETFSVDLD